MVDYVFCCEGCILIECDFKDVILWLELKDVDDFYEMLGWGCIIFVDFFNVVFLGWLDECEDVIDCELIDDDKVWFYVCGWGLILGVMLYFGECCLLLLGDCIIGLFRLECGVEIYIIDCEMLVCYDEDKMDEWLDLVWIVEVEENVVFMVCIQVVLYNELGVLVWVVQIVGENCGNIVNVCMLYCVLDFFEMLFDVEVYDVWYLVNLLVVLKMNEIVVLVECMCGEIEEWDEE